MSKKCTIFLPLSGRIQLKQSEANDPRYSQSERILYYCNINKFGGVNSKMLELDMHNLPYGLVSLHYNLAT